MKCLKNPFITISVNICFLRAGVCPTQDRHRPRQSNMPTALCNRQLYISVTFLFHPQYVIIAFYAGLSWHGLLLLLIIITITIVKTITIIITIIKIMMIKSTGSAYQLLNLRALRFSLANKMHILQCMGKIFCVEFQRVPFKFHTKYLTHTSKDMIFMQHWIFKSS